MANEIKGWHIPLIHAIGQSGLTFEEVAYLLGTTEAEVYDIARGYVPAGDDTKKRLAAITGKKESELFQVE